mgnify:FL=1|jgi:hypothetical protein
MKFKDSTTRPTGFVEDEGTEVGRYSERYLENALAELLALQKIIDRDIRNIEMKLEIKKQGREVRYEKYSLEDVQ